MFFLQRPIQLGFNIDFFLNQVSQVKYFNIFKKIENKSFKMTRFQLLSEKIRLILIKTNVSLFFLNFCVGG